jgi:hypothetical protein
MDDDYGQWRWASASISLVLRHKMLLSGRAARQAGKIGNYSRTPGEQARENFPF